MTRDDILKRLKDDRIEIVLFQFVDIHGASKCKAVPAGEFAAASEVGAGFAGGALWGMGQDAHDHDMMAIPDLNTYTPVPWEKGIARVACTIYVDGKEHPYCSRTLLRRATQTLKQEGYLLNVGVEPEHFLVKRENGTIRIADPDAVDNLDKPCYDFKGISGYLEYVRTMLTYMNQLGWGAYQCDHEDANGQFEINYAYSDALTTADRHTFFKMMTSQVAKKFGWIATHMAKPFADQTGSGLHFNFSLADAKTGKNVFIDERDPRGLGKSKLAYHFLGGLIKHARAMVAITSPTVNCYKRLAVGASLFGSRSGFTWTPAFITYGDNNRTQMFRTPEPSRFEDRTISAACNPYLAMAVYIAAGLDGIKNKLDPGEPNMGRNMYSMSLAEMKEKGIAIVPQSLPEALDELERDSVVQSALGKELYQEYLNLKRDEWRQYHRVITSWEVDRYLTLF